MISTKKKAKEKKTFMNTYIQMKIKEKTNTMIDLSKKYLHIQFICHQKRPICTPWHGVPCMYSYIYTVILRFT